MSAPRLYNKFYEAMMKNINEQSCAKRMLVHHALSSKLSCMKKCGQLTHCVYDKLVFKKIREVLGGRVRILVTASAPISAEI